MNNRWDSNNYTDNFQFVHKYGEGVLELLTAPKGSFVVDLGCGNGAFFSAIKEIGLTDYSFVDYSEHAISVGSDSKAISYIHLKNPQGKDVFSIGVSHNISYASMKGIVCAINRDQADTMRDDTMPGIFDVC